MGEGKAGLHTGLEAAGADDLEGTPWEVNWQGLTPGPALRGVYQFWQGSGKSVMCP